MASYRYKFSGKLQLPSKMGIGLGTGVGGDASPVVAPPFDALSIACATSSPLARDGAPTRPRTGAEGAATTDFARRRAHQIALEQAALCRHGFAAGSLAILEGTVP